MTRQDAITTTDAAIISRSQTFAEQVREMEEDHHNVRREVVASARALPFFAMGTKITQIALLLAAGTAIFSAVFASLG